MVGERHVAQRDPGAQPLGQVRRARPGSGTATWARSRRSRVNAPDMRCSVCSSVTAVVTCWLTWTASTITRTTSPTPPRPLIVSRTTSSTAAT
ncbi:hypothetical protein ACFQZ4_05390 [Catellatospora coxensis]